MNKLSFALTIAAITAFAAQGQQLGISLLGEKTVAGNQCGAQLSLLTKHQWCLGAFYQASWQPTNKEQPITHPFYGVSANAPLIQCDKMNFYFNIRCGVVNKYFVILAPGLETELKISKAFSVSSMMSVRMSYPSAMIRANLKF